MDSSAIKIIQDTAIQAQGINSGITDAATVALPTGWNIHSLEKYQDHRRRFTGTMTTNSIDDFIGYSNTNDGETCFIDAEKMTATTFFNLGDSDEPGHGDNIAKLSLKKTAAYNELYNITQKRLSQKELAEWLEDWRADIVALDSTDSETRQPINIIKAISAVRNITIKASREAEHSDSDFSAARTTMDKIEASAKEQLPAGFLFSCIPYDGLMEREFLLRMSIITSGDAPVIQLRVIQLEKQQEEIAKELQAKIGNMISQHTTVYIGTFAI